MNKKSMSKIAFILSLITLVLATLVSVMGMENFWLAGTQWILISIVLAVYSVYLNSCDCKTDKNGE